MYVVVVVMPLRIHHSPADYLSLSRALGRILKSTALGTKIFHLLNEKISKPNFY